MTTSLTNSSNSGSDTSESPAKEIVKPKFIYQRGPQRLSVSVAHQGFSQIKQAREALKQGYSVVGAIPFEFNHPAALYAVPQITCDRSTSFTSSDLLTKPPIDHVELFPSEADHRDNVRFIRSAIEQKSVTKVVLARSITTHFQSPIMPWQAFSRTAHRNETATSFCVDLSPAGPDFAGNHLFGASPELLIAKVGNTIRTIPHAGSAPRFDDIRADQASATQLVNSAKDNWEHHLLVQEIRRALSPLCASLDIAKEPELVGTEDLWHLMTPIVGTLPPESPITALDLLTTLHPTPAVCGVPQAQAM